MGDNAVYYQPPSSVHMTYPCIRYKLSNGDSRYADDASYIYRRRYTITLIDPNPDSIYIDKILELPMCSFDTSYISDNLNHYVFVIYW